MEPPFLRLFLHSHPGVLWEGWSVSLSWWAQVFGTRSDIADALYTLHAQTPILTSNNQIIQVPALGLNIVQYNLGASANLSDSYQNSSIQISKGVSK